MRCACGRALLSSNRIRTAKSTPAQDCILPIPTSVVYTSGATFGRETAMCRNDSHALTSCRDFLCGAASVAFLFTKNLSFNRPERWTRKSLLAVIHRDCLRMKARQASKPRFFCEAQLSAKEYGPTDLPPLNRLAPATTIIARCGRGIHPKPTGIRPLLGRTIARHALADLSSRQCHP